MVVVGWDRPFFNFNFIKRTGPNPSLYYIISFADLGFPGSRVHFLISAHFSLSSSDYSSLRPRRSSSIISSPTIFCSQFILTLTLPCIPLIVQSICSSFNSSTWAPFAVVLRFVLSFLPLFRPNLSFKGHRFRRRCQPLPFHAPQMCRKRRFWKGTFPRWSSQSPYRLITSPRFASFNTSRHAICTPSNTLTKQSACE
jgi:hypothetical protein